MSDLLLIKSLDLSALIEDYRLFFLSLLPSVFILALLIEYFDRIEPFLLLKRVFISILLLCSVTSFYQQSIEVSMQSANEILVSQKSGNILLSDMLGGIQKWDNLNSNRDEKVFFKDKSTLNGVLSFLRFHLFDKFINDGFTVSIYFITQICFLILKVVYSLIYYLGYGLIGIPCILYLFPSMGNVLRGAVLSYLWCIVVPHILVFILTLIGSEINRGYISGQLIGGSLMGTTLLFILTLFIAFTPLIAAMILNGSGISQAGGIIATIGANYVLNLPKNTLNTSASAFTGQKLGPKMQIANSTIQKGYRVASGAKNLFQNSKTNSLNNQNSNLITKSGVHSSSSNLSSNQNLFQKQNNSQSKIQGDNTNGAISRHQSINRQNKTSDNRYRNHRSSNANVSYRRRVVNKPKRK